MKKIFLLLICLMFLLPSVVKAGKKLEICSYNVTHKNSKRPVSISYYVDSKTGWNLTYTKSSGGNASKSNISFDNVFTKGAYPYVHFDNDSLKSSIKEFRGCPKYVFLDYNSYDELCFSNSKTSSFCESKVGSGDMKNYGEVVYKFDNVHIYEIKNILLERYKTEFSKALSKTNLRDNNTVKKLKENFYESASKVADEEYKKYFMIEQSLSSPTGLVTRLDETEEEVIAILNDGELTKIINEKIKETENLPDEEKQEIIDNLNEIIDEINGGNYLSVEDFDSTISEFAECSSLLGDPSNDKAPAYYISFAFKVLRYVAIIILIVLSVLDFVSAISSHDNDILKKTVSKVIIRAVLCVVIFLLPTLIDFILQFINDSQVSDCISIK